MKFFCYDHQGKSRAYVKALEEAGHEQTEDRKEASFLLIDIDVLSRAREIDQFHAMGKPSFLYPHTARPVLQWDGWYPPSPHVTAVFTIAEGGVEVPRTYGFTQTPIHPVGWTYCEIKSFSPTCPNKILFAPIHVNGNGFMTHRERSLNSKVFHRLLKLDVELTIRFLHELEWNGLWEEPGVTHVQGKPDQSTKEIDEAGVVVSHQNMGYLAVARGKPTLMMAEHLPPISGNSPSNVQMVKSWDKYRDLLMFPLDILESNDTMSMLELACRSDEPIREWKKKFIGNKFDPKKFVEILESYL